jgi:acyl-CoA-dependent ceramide synthase
MQGAKVLKYHGYNTACDLAFTVFILAWFLSRHVAYNFVVYSVYRDIPLYIPSGRYSTVTGQLLSTSLASPANETNKNAGKEILFNVLQPYLRPGGDIYFHRAVTLWFFGGLVALQAICVVWFAMIVRVAYRVIKGVGAEDVRSDDEDEGDDEEEDVNDEEGWGNDVKVVNLGVKNTPWQQQQQGMKRDMLPHPHHISSVHGKTVPARASIERLALVNSSSTGVAINGAQGRRRVGSPAVQRPSSKRKAGGAGQGGPLSLADRKDLLGRIGCDKPT